MFVLQFIVFIVQFVLPFQYWSGNDNVYIHDSLFAQMDRAKMCPKETNQPANQLKGTGNNPVWFFYS